jgi:hypothetical protein
VLVDELRGVSENVGVAACELHAEAALRLVPPQQRPLGRLPCDDVRRDGHLAARNVGAQADEDASEGQVADGSQGSDVHLA